MEKTIPMNWYVLTITVIIGLAMMCLWCVWKAGVHYGYTKRQIEEESSYGKD
jgi:hypothetical protein